MCASCYEDMHAAVCCIGNIKGFPPQWLCSSLYFSYFTSFLLKPTWRAQSGVMKEQDCGNIGHNNPLVKTTRSILELKRKPEPYGIWLSLKRSRQISHFFMRVQLRRLLSLSLLQLTVRDLFAFFFLETDHTLSFTAGIPRQDLNIQARRRAPGWTRILFQFPSEQQMHGYLHRLSPHLLPVDVWH